MWLLIILGHLLLSCLFYRVARKYNDHQAGRYFLPLVNFYYLGRQARVPGWCSLAAAGFPAGVFLAALRPFPFNPDVLWSVILAGMACWIGLWGSIARALGREFWLYGVMSLTIVPVVILAFDDSRPVTEAAEKLRPVPVADDVKKEVRAPDVPDIGGAAKLYCLVGQYADCDFCVPEEGLVIGRDPAFANIILARQEVSKSHLKVYPDPFDTEALIIEDMNSLNGTYRLVPMGGGGDAPGLGLDWQRLPPSAKISVVRGERFRVGGGETGSVAEFEVR